MRSCIAQFGRIWKDHSTMQLSDITGCDRTDARVSLSAGDDWEFSLFGTNLTDEATYSTIFKSGAGFVTGYPNRSRVVGVNVTHHF